MRIHTRTYVDHRLNVTWLVENMKIYRSTNKYIVGKYANLTIARIESNDGSGPIASNVKYYEELHT